LNIINPDQVLEDLWIKIINNFINIVIRDSKMRIEKT